MAEPHWLIRTSKNLISGPFSKDEIRGKILAGELAAQDEVCEANQYWLYLHERVEVLRSLGVELPKDRSLRAPDDDTTETQTETETQLHAAAQEASEFGEGASGELGDETRVRPARQPSPPAPSISTVEDSSPLPTPTPNSTPTSRPLLHNPVVLGGEEVDRSMIMRIFLWSLAVVAVFLFFAMIHILAR